MTYLLEPLLQPIGFLWLLHVAAAIWMARCRKWRESFFCAAVAVGIWLIGSTNLPTQLLALLERPYSGQNLDRLPQCDAIVMLGGTLSASSADLAGIDLGEGADRIVTAAEMFARGKARTLVLGGAGGNWRPPRPGQWSEAELLKPWLVRLGVPGTNVLHLRICSNTHDEALEVEALAKQHNWRRIMLVTSAYHMKRASGLFAKLNIQVEPVACDFLGLSTLEREHQFCFIPRSHGFHHLDLALHEFIGWQYYRLRGWIGSGE